MTCMNLLGLLFLCLATTGHCVDEHANCGASDCKPTQSWTDDVEVEGQGIKLLQVKGSKLAVIKDARQPAVLQPPKCDLDRGANVLPYGKGCPPPGVWGSSCLNGNTLYWSLSMAWAQCAKLPDCGAILSTPDGKFYLRRMSDPDLPIGDDQKAYIFSCPEREKYFEAKEDMRIANLKQEQELKDQAVRDKCPMMDTNIFATGKGCPDPGEHNGVWGTTCLNDNKPYETKEAAWLACAEVEGCGALLEMPNGEYYLRRRSDPDVPQGNDMYTIEFHCPAIDRERAEAAQTKVRQAREEAEKLFQEATIKCPIPDKQDTLQHGKGCPNPGAGSGNCLNGNIPLYSLQEAWVACAETQGCGAIMQSNNRFFLRRVSDPDTKSDGSYTMLFKCPALEGRTLKEVEEEDEIENLKRELAEARGQQQAAVMPAQAPAAPPAQLNDLPQASMPTEEAKKREEEEAQKREEEEAKKREEEEAKREEEEAAKKREEEEAKREEEEAAKKREEEEAKREEEEAAKKREEEEAAKSAEEAEQDEGITADQQAAQSQAELAEYEEAAQEEESDSDKAALTSQFQLSGKDLECGYSTEEKDCAWDNQAFLNPIGSKAPFRQMEKVSREDALTECGKVCAKADYCGGFSWHADSQTCWFRKNAKCGVYKKEGADCYVREDTQSLKDTPTEIKDAPQEAPEEHKEESPQEDATDSQQEEPAEVEEEEPEDMPEEYKPDTPWSEAAAMSYQAAAAQASEDKMAQIAQAKEAEKEAANEAAMKAAKSSKAKKKLAKVTKISANATALKDKDEEESESAEVKSKAAGMTGFHLALKDQDCGWSDMDKACMMDNQAYINAGERMKDKVNALDALHVCGELCAKAEYCGGFSYHHGDQTCWFRKNATCGQWKRTGADCYMRGPAAPEHLQELPPKEDEPKTEEQVSEDPFSEIAQATEDEKPIAAGEPLPLW